MQLMGYDNGKEDLVVVDGEIMKVERGTLHCKPICAGEVSVYVTRSHIPAYVLYEAVDMDDSEVTKTGTSSSGRRSLYAVDLHLSHSIAT
jgi:hypothetical protein